LINPRPVCGTQFAYYQAETEEKSSAKGNPMTATCLHPASTTPSSFGAKELQAIIVEPFLIVAVSLFWMVVLPIAGLFCSGVAISEKINALKRREVRIAWSYRYGFRAETRTLGSSV